MIWLSRISLLLLSVISTTMSISMSCYPNGSLILPSNAVLYNNMTFGTCQCLSSQQNISAFQYDNSTKSCYVFVTYQPLSNIRVTINSQVCFINRTAMSYSETTATASTSSSPSSVTGISTSITGGTYYESEALYFQNTVSLTYLSITIIVQKTYTLYNPASYETIGSNIISKTINDTDTYIVYTFNIINEQTLWPGQWSVGAQFALDNQVRDASNDTYSIQTNPSQIINGHF